MVLMRTAWEVFGDMSQRAVKLALTTRNMASNRSLQSIQVLPQHASRLDKLAWLLKECQREVEVGDLKVSGEELSEMEAELIADEEVMEFYASRSSLYLVMACAHLAKRLRDSCTILSQALGLICRRECSSYLKQQLVEMQKVFEEGTLDFGSREQELVDCLGKGMLDTDACHDAQSTELAQLVADCLGTALDSEAFREELAKLQTEKSTAAQREGKAHAMVLEQYINVLERAVSESTNPEARVFVASPRQVCSMKHTSAVVLPLQSFICPITKDVMKDPVQIASGQTYERAAIERWFAVGHTRCPLGVELKNTKMKPNLALRQSIAEWRERNWTIRMQIAESAFSSENLDDKKKAVLDIQALCEEDSLNRYSVASRGLIAPLVHLAESKDVELRIKTLSALQSLAQDNDENQEIMVKEGLTDLIVRSLARPPDESQQAISLLCLLSANPASAEVISHAQGAILLLVTLLGSPLSDIAEKVKIILENLPKTDDNVIIMAKANVITPLVLRLVDGGLHSKILMAKTLANLHISETMKQQMAKDEAISTLIKMMASSNSEESESAISALTSLSSVPVLANMVAAGGALYILKNKLTFPKSSVDIKIGVSHVLSNILVAWGSTFQDDGDSRAELDSLVYTCLSLLPNASTPPMVQDQLLRGLLGLAKGKCSRKIAKAKMVERQAFSTLIPLLKSEVRPEISSPALILFDCLSAGNSSAACIALKEKPESINFFVQVIQNGTGQNEKVLVAAVNVLANLPPEEQEITSALVQANAVQLLVSLFGHSNPRVEEAVSGALLRFTAPSNVEMQRKLASLGVISKLVSLLDSGRSLAKERAARALANFSINSDVLCLHVAPRKWWACFSPQLSTCQLHPGICTVESSFCLLEADAISPLLSVLEDQEDASSEAALAALYTLAQRDNVTREQGIHLIARANGVLNIVKSLSSGSLAVQEVALNLVERIFRFDVYKRQYGMAAQMHIITLAQRAPPHMRNTAGKVLRQLELLHSQSVYFSQSHSAAQ